MCFFFDILKTFQVITIKLWHRFRLRKCYFGFLAVKYKQSGLSKNADTVFGYENVIIGAIKRHTSDLELRKGKAKSVNKAFVLFIYLKLPNKNKTAI